MAERIEALITLTYISCFLMAYYGPNADSLGNIKLTMWQYKAITDINQLIQNLCILAGIDLLSGFFNAILLWTTCKINVFKVLKGIQKDLWLIMGVQEAFFFVQVKNITKYNSQLFPATLDILFCQITTFIKVCVAYVFGLQTL